MGSKKTLNIAAYLYQNVTTDKLKIQKLLYIAFGFYAAFENGGLFI